MTSDEVRQVTDSRVLAALAHPLRRRLMDVLKVHGPATASTLATSTGQAIGNVSHHLRVLGGCNLIEEAPELARDRRERWWRLVSRSLRWNTGDFGDDPATTAVVEAAQSLDLDHHTQLVRAWYAAAEDERAGWSDSAFSLSQWMHLGPDELQQLGEEIREVLDRWRDRPAGGERKPVFVYAYGVPGRP